MDSNFDLVKEFHRSFDVPILPSPCVPDFRRRQLRLNLLAEEYRELTQAIDSNDLTQISKESCDLLVVIYGTALEYGICIDAAFKEVHRSNMSKLGHDGKPIIREEDGKVLKGPNYSLPDPIKLIQPIE